MEPFLVDAVLERVQKTWPVANDLEVTLEANPSSVEAKRFSDFAKGGVNRISLGIQALNDHDLKRLGRLHTASDAKKAFGIARSVFDRVSFDLIYARQDQTLSSWETELREALTMAVDHISLYQLTVEPGTAFWDRKAIGGLKGLPDEDLAADMFEVTQDICESKGLPAYEVSNHAKFGSESRHNVIYWRYGDYVGIGPGAHGRITLGTEKFATECWSQPYKWLTEVTKGTPEKKRDKLPVSEQSSESLMMGLRLTEGVDLNRLKALHRTPYSEAGLRELLQLELVETVGNHLRATAKGRLMLNSVIRTLMPD